MGQWNLRIGQQSGHQTPILPVVSSTPRSTSPGLQRLPLRGIRFVSVACFLSRVLPSYPLHPQTRACIGDDWPNEYSLVPGAISAATALPFDFNCKIAFLWPCHFSFPSLALLLESGAEPPELGRLWCVFLHRFGHRLGVFLPSVLF